MASLWQEFVDTVDAQISVNDTLFWTDFKGLLTWPLLPFFIVILIANPPSIAADVALAAMVLFEVWWTIFPLPPPCGQEAQLGRADTLL